jgi:urate oxidase
MALVSNKYGKGRVRIMRVEKREDIHIVREMSLQVMLEGEFDDAYTRADNRKVIATDTIRNIVNLIAREHVEAGAEMFCQSVAKRFLDQYDHVEKVSVSGLETRWTRIVVDGAAHPHGFTLDGNGKPVVKLTQTRAETRLESGIEDFTFLKSTGSAWADYVMDEFTTLPETRDRIAATSMNASWLWATTPADYAASNEQILQTMLQVFVTTYSAGVQDSLYRMAEAALNVIPEIAQISLACPNKHYLPLDLSRFGVSADNMVFTPTDEPHGQIECVVARNLYQAGSE